MINNIQLRKFIVVFAILGVLVDISLGAILGELQIESETKNMTVNIVRTLYYSILVGSMAFYLIRKLIRRGQ